MKNPSVLNAVCVLFVLPVILVSGNAQTTPPLPFDGTVATPIHGVGHDYIDDLNETVNPATGSLSIRVQIPTPHERGLQVPLFAYLYDSAGQSPVAPVIVPCPGATNDCTVARGLSFEAAFGAPTGGMGFFAGGIDSNHSAIGVGSVVYKQLKLVHNYGAEGSAVCNYRGEYVYTDMSGGRHPLNFNFVPPGADRGSFGCTTQFGITGSGVQVGGDDVYKAQIDDNGLVNIRDVHGNQLNPSIYNINGQTDLSDTYGNGVNGTGRVYTQTSTSLTVPGLGAPYTYTVVPNTPPSNTQQPYPFNEKYLAGSDPNCQSMYMYGAYGNYSGKATVTLPNNQAFVFVADPLFGLVSDITYPTGAGVHYTWTMNTHAEVIDSTGTNMLSCYIQYDEPAISRRVVRLTGSSSFNTPVLQQDFTYTTNYDASIPYRWISKTTKVVTTDLVTPNHPTSEIDYSYLPMPPAIVGSGTIKTGYLPVESLIVYKDGSGSVLKTVNKTWNSPNQLASECTTLDDGKTAGIFYTYQGLSPLPTDKKEYDYGTITLPCIAPSTIPVRETATVYFSADNPTSVKIYGNGVIASDTEYSYNEYPRSTLDPAPLNYTSKGGDVVTTITRKCYYTATNASPTPCTDSAVHAWWDEAGMPTKVQDANGNFTTYGYDDTYTSDDGSPPQGASTHTYLTKITAPITGTTNHTHTFQYGYNQGLLRKSTDVENSTSEQYYYSDPWKRISEIDYADGGVTSYTYDDSSRTITSSTLLNIVSVGIHRQSSLLTKIAVQDTLGRETQTQLTSDPQGTVFTDYTYDGFGRKMTASNPYRSTSDPTSGTTSFSYDALGRMTLQCQPDNSASSTAPCIAGLSYQQWSYVGNTTSFRNELGKVWVRTTDALGRLRKVVEPGTLMTSYTYDAMNKLVCADQWETAAVGSPCTSQRKRSFTYDTLSRLVTAFNPETGIICYGILSSGKCQSGYDPNGNLIHKTDTRGIVVSYAYDALNRLLSKTYSNDTLRGTASSCYQYDQSSMSTTTGNLVGRLTNAWTQKGSCASSPGSGTLSQRSVLSYDPMGRILSEQQCARSTCGSTKTYKPSYIYDLSGNIIKYSDGTGANTFNNSYDTADHLVFVGRATAISTSQGGASAASQDQTSLFSATTFSSTGALTGGQFGSGLQLTRTYDKRLRISSEVDNGLVVPVALPGSGVITIPGLEQTKP